MDSLCLVMPAYNEEDNIEKVIKDWYPVVDDKAEGSRLVINISGSCDDTETIIRNLINDFPKIEIIKDSENSYRAKLLDLYDYAVKTGCDYVFQTDSDGQTNPAEFDSFWQLRNEYDAVIGSRSGRADGIGRIFVEKVVVFLILVYFRVKLPDANAPFRLMNADILSKYLKLVPCEYSMPNILFTALFCACDEKVLFREISFGKRSGGKNKMNYKKIFESGFESLRVFSLLGKSYGK